LWGPDSSVVWIDNGDAGGKPVKVGLADEIGDEGVPGRRAQSERAESAPTVVGFLLTAGFATLDAQTGYDRF
jgi:hypothetical protein